MNPGSTQASASRWLWALRISTLASVLPVLVMALTGLSFFQQAAWTGRLLLGLMVPCSAVPYLLVLWRFRANSPRLSGVIVAVGEVSVWYLVGILLAVDILTDVKGKMDWYIWAVVAYWVAVMVPHTVLLASVLKTKRILHPLMGDKRVFVLDLFLAIGCFAAFIVILTLLSLSI
jgi:hypothetical protein